MSDVDIERGQEVLTALKEMLHVVAAHPEPARSAPLVLQTLQGLTGAIDGGLLLFDEPELHITLNNSRKHTFPESTLAELASSLAEGIHVNPSVPDNLRLPYENWLAAPVLIHDRIGGLLWLGFTGDAPASEEVAALAPLLDVFTLIATTAQARARSKRAHQLKMSLLNSIPDPLLVLDDTMHVLLINPAAEKVFNVTAAVAVGKPLREVVKSDDLVALAEGKRESLEEWVWEDDNTFVPRIETAHDAEGRVEGWVLALRDITHFKRLNRNQSEFMRIVSHDLRSPLTSMQGFASMLESQMVGELNEKQAHFIEKILAGVSQMTALVDNIQDAGRFDPETGFYDMQRAPCDLVEIVQRIVNSHLVPAEKQELSISVDAGDDVPIISADGNMLERAMINLVDNAIKYTPNGGQIAVAVKRQGEEVWLSVRDNGYGISPENQKRLFERHTRIPRQEHKKVKGSGLGLFIVRSVAQRHGGDAWVESNEGTGSEFYLSIPLQGPNLLASTE